MYDYNRAFQEERGRRNHGRKTGSIFRVALLIAAVYGIFQMIASMMMWEGRRLERDNRGRSHKRYLLFMNGGIRKLKDEDVESIDLVGIMGGAELDLTGARLASDTKIHISCLMSGLVIKVPPMVEVVEDSKSIMGGVANMVPRYGKEGIPVIHLDVECLMSGVSIKVVC